MSHALQHLSRRCALAGLAGAAALGHGPLRAQRAVRLASGYQADSFHGLNLTRFAQDLSAAGLAVSLHANNGLVRMADIPVALARGQLEMGEVLMSELAADMPMAGADSLPFVVRSYADARRLWSIQRPLIDGPCAARDLVVLFAVPWPPQGLCTQFPLVSVTGLRGVRMRTYNAASRRFAQLVGAQPVDVAASDIVRALAERQVDCMITSAATAVDARVWTEMKFFYDINAWIPKNISLAHAGFVDSLGASERQILVAAAEAAEARGWQASLRAATASLEALRSQRMAVERPGAHLAADLKRIAEHQSLAWIRSIGGQANRLFLPYFTA